MKNGHTETHLVLGLLNEKLVDSTNPLKTSIQNSYGLYCDNVFLGGTMFSLSRGNGSDNYLAGITTKNNFLVVDTNGDGTNDSYAVLFAGQTNSNSISYQNLSFYVTNTGYLYANNGYFKGEIEASLIKTSKIVGNNDKNYALVIDGFTTNLGLVFGTTDKDKNITNNYVCFNNDRASFFQFDDTDKKTSQTIMSILGSKNNSLNNGIGMFFEDDISSLNDITKYKLSFVMEGDYVSIRSSGTEVAKISDVLGFSISGGSSLGSRCVAIDSKNTKGEIIGVDFVILA
jgi:hypothetical protein